MKVLAGDWKADTPIVLKKNWLGRPTEIWFATGVFRADKIKFQDITMFEIVTEDNKASILGKLGWGALGTVALGPLGLLAGVIGGGNRQDRVMALTARDGRKVMIKGSAKDAEMFMAAAFDNNRAIDGNTAAP